MLDKLCTDMSYDAMGHECEFNVNELTICIK